MTKMTTRFSTICTMERKYRKHTFYVDIVLDHKEQTYNSWIYADDYGVKNYMFGVPVSYTNAMTGQTRTETVDGFIAIAMDGYNFPNSANLYIEEYMPEEGDQI